MSNVFVRYFFVATAASGLAAAIFGQSLPAPVAGPSVNMVSGTQWPGGDPFLERQNEPSMAVSSRNALHLLAGANDYRTVDLPGLPTGDPTGDAWLGLFNSFDGGKTWTSTLVPGYPQDQSSQGMASPLYGLQAAADPFVRAGTNGLFYYSGIVFNRTGNGNSNPPSRVFVARFIDDNNLEGADTIRYLGASLVDSGNPGHFVDKPSTAVDIARAGSSTCVVPGSPAQSFPGGNIYIAWTDFNGPKANGNGRILLSRSTDCGNTWSKPSDIAGPQYTNQGAALAIDPSTGAVYVAWRVFASGSDVDSIMLSASYDGGKSWSKPFQVAAISAFDQATTNVSFRTNAYPAIAVDGASRVYISWSERGLGPNGDARVVLTSAAGLTGNFGNSNPFPAATMIDPYSGRGHQFMPAMAFSSGKLSVAWYDLRLDDELGVYQPLGGGMYSVQYLPDGTVVWGPYVQDPLPPYQPTSRRNTLDVRLAQAVPGYPTAFGASIQISQYEFGSLVGAEYSIQQLQVDPPNLPMFQLGTVPFFGDYIDVAGPTFVPLPGGAWRANILPTDPDYTRVVWTDNRNVVQPADGDWTHYTPVGVGGTSIFDPTQQRPACAVGQGGSRNQDIYTGTASPLLVSAKSNSKQLSTSLQREFPITVENTTTTELFYRLTIQQQPVGGSASFLQFPVTGLPNPMTTIDVQIPALSSTARSIYVTSSNPNASVGVNVIQIVAPNGAPVPNGLTSSVAVNTDVSNPNISNPNISNTELYNPNISNPNISNPNISNPNISNPNISNPNISNVTIDNPNISNPNISNPNISNPNISNPNISNPNISNPNISNTSLSDTSWTLSNNGNTASSYSLKLLQSQAPPQGVSVQLIVSKTYNTPAISGCNLAVETHYQPVTNIPSPTFSDPSTLAQPPDPTVPSISLLPGENALVTIRSLDTTTSNPAQALARYNPSQLVTPVAIAPAKATPNSPPLPPTFSLVVLSLSLPPATATGSYSQPLNAAGGTPPYSWSITSGNADGLTVNTTTGLLQGVLTSAFPSGTTFTVTLSDSAGSNTTRTFNLIVNPAPAIIPASLPSVPPGSAYPTETLQATGGTAPLVWSLASGQPPAGLTLSPAGVISGTTSASAVSSTFTVQVADANGVAATQVLSIQVISNLPPSLTGGALPAATENVPYSYSIPVTNGAVPFSFQITQGNLPPNLTLSPTGTISGVPAAGCNWSFTVQVTDSSNNTASAVFSLNVITPNTMWFSGAYQMQNWTMSASNGGSQAITPASGSSGCPAFSYNISSGDGGVSARTWTFQTIAAQTGTATFAWHYTGFHAYFDVTALLQVFSREAVTTLYSAGPANCCTAPSGGFDVYGTASIPITAGSSFGFIVGGSNFDSNAVLQGTLSISNFVAPGQ